VLFTVEALLPLSLTVLSRDITSRLWLFSLSAVWLHKRFYLPLFFHQTPLKF